MTISLLRHQGRILWQDRQRLLNLMLTLSIVLVLFGMVLSHYKGILANEILLITSFVVINLGLPHLFQEDIQSGFLEAYVATGRSLEGWVALRTLGYWLSLLGPLLLVSVIFSSSFAGPPLWVVLSVQALTSFIIVMLGAIGSVLVLNVHQSSLLLPLISLPIMVPSLLVSFGILESGGNPPYFYILVALSSIAVALSWSMTPFAIRLVLR